MGVLVDNTRTERGSEKTWEVVVVNADGFFGEGSEHRTRSRRMGRRNTMHRGIDQGWQEVLDWDVKVVVDWAIAAGDPLGGVGSGFGLLLVEVLGGGKEDVEEIGQGRYAGGGGNSKSGRGQ